MVYRDLDVLYEDAAVYLRGEDRSVCERSFHNVVLPNATYDSRSHRGTEANADIETVLQYPDMRFSYLATLLPHKK